MGGTAEGRKLAEALGPRAMLSWLGLTAAQSPKPKSYQMRTGRFGGITGLTNYLLREKRTAVVDATHPFAAQMSQNAAAACAASGLPLLRLQRAAWPDHPEWTSAQSLEMAAKVLPLGARVFLSVGSQSIAPFMARNDLWCLARSITPPATFPQNGEVVLQRPPFDVEAEIALIRIHKITHLVSKNAGGNATYAKLEAAKKLGVQVIMVKRPHLPAALTVETVGEAVKWVANLGE